MVTFNLWQSQQNAHWYFNIEARNGERIAQSEGYTSRQSAAHTIDLIRSAAGQSSVNEYRGGRWTRIA